MNKKFSHGWPGKFIAIPREILLLMQYQFLVEISRR